MDYKLICFDMDGVLIENTNFWIELHKKLGTLKEGKELTKKYLYTNYKKLVEEVVENLWKDKNAKPYYELVNSIKYNPGIKELFEHIKKRNYKTAIISSSSIDIAKKIQKEYKINYIFANKLVIKNEKITGKFLWPIGPGKEKKAEIIKKLCSKLKITPKQVIYIGDGENDIEAFKIVGLPIAFNTKTEELKKHSKHIINKKNLKEIIKYIP